MHPRQLDWTRSPRFLALAVWTAATAVYWRTAYPSIDWWDSSSYSLAAATLGITSAPGSLLLTLLGYPIARIAPATSIAHVLNLFAGVIAALTATIVFFNALRLARRDGVPE